MVIGYKFVVCLDEIDYHQLLLISFFFYFRNQVYDEQIIYSVRCEFGLIVYL